MKWINVEKELPGIGTLVWGYDKRRGIIIICWREYRWFDNNIITTWMSYEYKDIIVIEYWMEIPKPGYPTEVISR